MRSLLSSLAITVLFTACNRTPPEPAPAASTNADPIVQPRGAGALPAAIEPARCITKLPSTPPPTPPPGTAAMCPVDPEPTNRMAVADVSFPDVAPGDARADLLKIQVELAKSAHDVERGLMYRQKMGDDHGMLFKLDGRRDHTFWMRNTCISLDMMFIDEDGVIAGIVEGATPLNESPRSVGCPSLYVLEVNGGWSRKHGVAPGQKIVIPAAAR